MKRYDTTRRKQTIVYNVYYCNSCDRSSNLFNNLVMKKITIIGASILILTCFTLSIFQVEKQKTQIEAQKDMIRELTDSLHTYEVMYLKCAGSVEAEQHGAHYIDGKIKFYNIK